MFKKLVVATSLCVAVLSASSAAWALDCHNVSRAAPSASAVPSNPVVSFDNGDGTSFNIWLAQGNWYWFTINDNTTGVEEFQAWGFVPPGSLGSDPFATVFAGYHGNYQAGQGFALLDKSACPPARQTTHGLQSVCSG